MSKSNAFEEDVMQLIFNGVAIPNIADNAASSPLTNLYVSLHTGDPGEAGDQQTSECTYTGYARVAVPRTAGGWIVSGGAVNPSADIDFPPATGGSETATHYAIGTAATGAGLVLFRSTSVITPSVAIADGVTPRLLASSQITED